MKLAAVMSRRRLSLSQVISGFGAKKNTQKAQQQSQRKARGDLCGCVRKDTKEKGQGNGCFLRIISG